MIISRTPYRISLLGGGTDFPAWFLQNGGEVLAGSIDRYCYLTCRYLPPFFEHRFRIVYSITEDRRLISEIQHPVVRATLETMDFRDGLEIHHDGDLPARSGIGSSSSFTVGILHALHALRGEMISKSELARSAIHIEQNVLGEHVGCQDQVTVAHGGLNHIEFFPGGGYRISPLILPPGYQETLTAHFMLFFTGLRRLSSDIAATYAEDLEAKADLLNRVKASVGVGKELLQSMRLDDFGALMHDCWLAKRALSSAISRPEIDAIYEAAREAGALGGKVLGAGGGGFMLLVVPPDRQAAVRARLKKLLQVPFSFENSGSHIIFYDPEKIEKSI